MPVKSSLQSIDSPPATLTPLQLQAIKWIAGMRFAMSRHEKSRLYSHLHNSIKRFDLRANQLQVGMNLITRKGNLYAITEISPYQGDRLKIKAKNSQRSTTFFYNQDTVVSVEGI